MRKYSDSELKAFGLIPGRIPKHIAIVMDGNGRWATAKGLPRGAGHRAGVNALRDIIRFTSDIGAEALTIYAFSTENRKRPKDEIGILCGLLIEYFNREIDELHANGVRIKSIGDLSWFPTAVQETVRAAEVKTANNPGLKLNIALTSTPMMMLSATMLPSTLLALSYCRWPSRSDISVAPPTPTAAPNAAPMFISGNEMPRAASAIGPTPWPMKMLSTML